MLLPCTNKDANSSTWKGVSKANSFDLSPFVGSFPSTAVLLGRKIAILDAVAD